MSALLTLSLEGPARLAKFNGLKKLGSLSVSASYGENTTALSSFFSTVLGLLRSLSIIIC